MTKRASTKNEEVQTAGPLPLSGKTLMGMPMEAHEASWRMGGAPRFFTECIEAGIDLRKFKTLDKVYRELERIEELADNLLIPT